MPNMNKMIIGKKLNMTQTFKEDGSVVPVTVVLVEPCVITQVKNMEKDGYTAIQVGYGTRKDKNLSKALLGHFGKNGNFAKTKEFRVEEKNEYKAGDKLDVSQFEVGDKVKVSGTSKGKGFQGVVKRHGFHGAPASHGHKDQLRMPGSIGATGPAKVFKGVRMPGQMGNAKSTVANLEVVKVDAKNNEIYLKGAVPGARNSIVTISA